MIYKKQDISHAMDVFSKYMENVEKKLEYSEMGASISKLQKWLLHHL